MPVMSAKYPGKCTICGERFPAGERIFYAGKKQASHLGCRSGRGNSPAPEAASPEAGFQGHPAASLEKVGNVDRMVIEWPEVRNFVSEVLASNDYSRHLQVAGNRTTMRQVTDVEERFTGYSLGQAQDWLENGYETDALKDVENFAPPIREQPMLVYSDEGDEIDLSAAWSGEEDFFLSWELERVIPGVKLEFSVQFSAFTEASVVNAYQLWMAQAITAIQAAGIDPEINVVFTGGNTFDSRDHQQVVRVKREGETVDFKSWSTMMSPAAYRTFGFMVKVLHGDMLGSRVGSSIGRVNNERKWGVKYSREDGTIAVATEPRNPKFFPAEMMTAQLRQAIEELKGTMGE